MIPFLNPIIRFWKNRYQHIRFRLSDIICLTYFALLSVLLPFFHKNVPFWQSDFIIHWAFVFVGLEFIRFGERNSHNNVLWMIRTFYPVVFYLYAYLEVGHLGQMFFGSNWAIQFLVNADKAIFGVHPTVWIERFYTPWLDEVMALCFSGYYLFMPIVALPLFFRGRREETLAAFSIAAFAYFTNYLFFYIFPALSPRMIPWMEAMNTKEYSGYLFASITRIIQGEKGVLHGGVFPSSHISGSLAWSLAALRYNRRLGVIIIPVVLGIAFSTVYLRYHHAVDPIAGLMLGLICYPITLILLKKRGEDPHSR